MSYILDALRRADAERERGAVPGLHAQALPGGPLQAGSPRRLLWVGFAGAALLVVALAALAGWLWGGGASRQSLPGSPAEQVAAAPIPPAVPAISASPATPAVSAAAAPVATTTTQAPTSPVVAPANRNANTNSDTSARSITRQAPTGTAPAAEQPPPNLPRRSARTLSDPSEEPADKPARSAATADADAVPGATRRVLSLDELPPEIRRALPALTVSGSIYSEDASSRFVMINGEAVREGGRITPELTLEQIRLKSAVLRYKGYRYRLPL